MTTETTHKYAVDDLVRVDGYGCDYATVLGYEDAIGDREPDTDGHGPLYLINVGNVFGVDGAYEYVVHESELLGLCEPAPHSTVTKMAVEHVDGMNVCVTCGQRAGVTYDPRNPQQGWFVHDRTGRVECGLVRGEGT